MSSRTEIHVLQEIAAVAHRFARISPISATTLSTSPCVADLPADDCDFPPPYPLASDLSAAGLDSRTTERVSNIYLEAVAQLKSECKNHYRRTSRAYIQSLLSSYGPDLDYTKQQSLLRTAYASRYTRTIESWVDQIVNTFLPRVLDAIKTRQRSAATPSWSKQESRRPFNRAALPVLVRIFESNPFPTRSERLELAARTDMECRQIDVWFQNRRNRFRKDGKELGRGRAFDKLPPELGHAVVEILSEHESDNTSSSEEPDLIAELSTKQDISYALAVFNLERPPHAYPTSYPPSCSYNPFPIQEGARSFTTPWIRECQPSGDRHPDTEDVTHLSDRLARLSIVDEGKHEHTHTSSQSQSPTREHMATALGFITTTPRAPLPALLPACQARSRCRQSCYKSVQENSSSKTPTCRKKLRRKATAPQRMPDSTKTSSRKESPLMFSNSSSTPAFTSSSTSNTSRSSLWHPITSASKTQGYFPSQPSRHPSIVSASNSSSLLSTQQSLQPVSTYHESKCRTIVLPHYRPHSSLQTSMSPRKIAAFPKRSPNASNPSRHFIPSDITDVSSLPSSRTVSTRSRMSSISSISSVSSSGSSSPSNESDDPLTPPMLAASLPEVATSLALGPLHVGCCFSKHPLHGTSTNECLQFDTFSGDLTRRQEVQKGLARDLPLGALVTEVESTGNA